MLIRLSFGLIGWNAAKMPVIKLTTIGRKSGLPRSVMLTSPYKENDSLVIVASKGGSDTPPDWLLNLKKEPDVEVSIQGAPSMTMRAEVADENERNRLWPAITKDYSNYVDYQTKTSRVIPLIFLRPVK